MRASTAQQLGAMHEEKPRRPYRMKDLCEITGLPRQVIHFYIQQGLVPEGRKTGRNMAYYGDEHVDRIRLVRELQHERFLPLKAIKAMLDEQEGAFSPSQRRMMAEVRHRLPKYLKAPREPVATVDAKALAKEFGVTRDELSTMHSSGLLELVPSARGGLRVAEEDAWVIRLYGEVKACGFDRCPGFSPDDFAVYDAFLEDLFAREKNLFLERMDGLPSEDVVQLLEKALPFIHTFLARRHETRIRRFFETMESILQTHRGQVQDP